ncbi:MAG: DUF1015 domain-containing protein, partial [Deltaproteobacteria bacterium]|nr:DUF1015 domain-containing protein [Deltaproteobacteria bacterium]
SRLVREGALVRSAEPSFGLYELTWRGHTQTGVVLCASVPEYEQNMVRRHEHTRPDKENDRVRHIEATQAQTGVVFLVYRDERTLAREVAALRAQPAEIDFTAADGVRHRTWTLSDPARMQKLVVGFAAAGPLYIADGHHRSAAAARVAAQRRRGTPDATSPYERFLAVAFAASEVHILPYNRVVHDLAARSAEQFLREVSEAFVVREGKPQDGKPHQIVMFLDRWYTLTPKRSVGKEPVARLDVSILQDRLLGPVLGILDPRRDKRIEFVGGVRGDEELVQRVQQGAAVAFSLHATALDDLFAIADAGEVMPPKSTWFEPKLRDGLVVYTY